MEDALLTGRQQLSFEATTIHVEVSYAWFFSQGSATVTEMRAVLVSA